MEVVLPACRAPPSSEDYQDAELTPEWASSAEALSATGALVYQPYAVGGGAEMETAGAEVSTRTLTVTGADACPARSVAVKVIPTTRHLQVDNRKWRVVFFTILLGLLRLGYCTIDSVCHGASPFVV